LQTGNPRHVTAFKVANEYSLTAAVLLELIQATVGRGARLRFKACGFSMCPFIRNEDVLTVAPLNGASPGLGDVVAFRRPDTGKLVIHRIVGKKGGSYLIKGDNALESDGLVTRAEIAARVVKVERDGRRVFIGLGPERRGVALLSRRNLHVPLLRFICRIYRPVLRRTAA